MGQQIIALVLVAFAAFYLGRQWVGAYRRVWRGESTGCGGGCGKCSCGGKQPNLAPQAATPNVIQLGEIGDFRRGEH